ALELGIGARLPLPDPVARLGVPVARALYLLTGGAVDVRRVAADEVVEAPAAIALPVDVRPGEGPEFGSGREEGAEPGGERRPSGRNQPLLSGLGLGSGREV